MEKEEEEEEEKEEESERRSREWKSCHTLFVQEYIFSNSLTWLKVGLLCSREHWSPCRQAPILK